MTTTIRTRMWATCAVSVASLTLLWAVSWGMSTTLGARQAEVAARLATADLVLDAAALLQDLDAPGNDVLASGDHRAERARLADLGDAWRAHEQRVLAAIDDDPDLRAGWEVARPQVRELVDRASEVMDLVAARERAEQAGDAAAARSAADLAAARMADMDQACARASGVLRQLEATQRRRVAASMTEATAANHAAVLVALVLLAVALPINLGMAWVTIRSVTQPVGEALRIAERIAGGDLRESASEPRDDEIGKLLVAMQHMAAHLRTVLSELRGGVEQLSTSTVAIGATATQYAASSSEQAASVAQISATVEEIKQTSAAAATAAQDVAGSGDDAADRGREGRGRLDEAVVTMGVIDDRVRAIAAQILRLTEQTSQIGEIVESVNDLAEQSNLLAVNASIEAAKAGEHGRGFAVVASEVRSLAEQSKRATQQIRAILADVQKATHSAVMATEEGTKRADDGRRAIERLRDLVDALAGTLEDSSGKGRQIAAAASQQASGIAQIAVAMDGVTRAGQDNAKGVRQLDQAVRDLGALAAELRRTSDRFVVA